MKYPAYPKYKDSGVEWLGEVPEHWELSRFSRKVFIAEGQVNPEESPYLDMFLIAPNYIESGTGRLLSKETAAEQGAESGKYFCMNGDVIYSKIRPSLAKVVMASEDCLCSADMYPLRGKGGVCNKFIYWVLLSRWFIAWSVLESDRVAMPKINRESLNSCLLCLPSLPEQQGIATFLDAQTSKLDALIAKKRELIAKLQEKRAALITRTVTRGLPPEAAKAAGLDPHPKMKDSGVKWLGEVPEHWEVKRLRFAVSKIEQGWSPQCYNHKAENGEWGVLKVGCVNMFRFNPDQNKALPEELEPKVEYKIEENDILMSRANTRELLGSAALVEKSPDTKLLLCDKLYRIRGTPKLHPSFLVYFMSTTKARFHYEREATGTSGSMQNIGQDTVKNLPVLIPPRVEQVTILEYIQQRLKRIDTIIGQTENVIRILQEYRSALITAAVTGKIDVSNIPPEAA